MNVNKKLNFLEVPHRTLLINLSMWLQTLRKRTQTLFPGYYCLGTWERCSFSAAQWDSVCQCVRTSRSDSPNHYVGDVWQHTSLCLAATHRQSSSTCSPSGKAASVGKPCEPCKILHTHRAGQLLLEGWPTQLSLEWEFPELVGGRGIRELADGKNSWAIMIYIQTDHVFIQVIAIFSSRSMNHSKDLRHRVQI